MTASRVPTTLDHVEEGHEICIDRMAHAGLRSETTTGKRCAANNVVIDWAARSIPSKNVSGCAIRTCLRLGSNAPVRLSRRGAVRLG